MHCGQKLRKTGLLRVGEFRPAGTHLASFPHTEETMELKVDYQGGTRFDISAGRHMVVADQPVEDGGSDAGPSPIELFVASLGSCVAYFIVRYCHRHGIPADGFHLRARATFAEQPHR